jgi:hypothetical protein
VTFSTPKAGASGLFINGQTNLRTRTDAEGHATGSGFRPNGQSGKYIVTATADLSLQSGENSQKLTGFVQIPQQNSGGGMPTWVYVVGGVAAAGGGACAALCKGQSATTLPPVTITGSTGTFGAPH